MVKYVVIKIQPVLGIQEVFEHRWLWVATIAAWILSAADNTTQQWPCEYRVERWER